MLCAGPECIENCGVWGVGTLAHVQLRASRAKLIKNKGSKTYVYRHPTILKMENFSIAFSNLSRLTWTVLLKLHATNETPKSTFFSPFSVTIALGMVFGGAEDDVKNEFLNKLGVQDIGELQALGAFMSAAKESDSSSKLSSANAIFTDTSFELYKAYKTYLQGFNTEYFQYPKLAPQTGAINSWIEGKTNGLVQDMLSESQLLHSHSVIVNALAFRGSWENKFNKNHTKKAPFRVSADEQREVDMMHMHKQKIWFCETPKYKAVRLSYGPIAGTGSTGSMIAFLPVEGISLEETIASIMAEQPGKPSSFHRTQFDQFGFPKFEVTGDYSLKQPLGELGYPMNASFPHMGSGPSIISDIIHKAFLQVDEEGTTAAAATAVIMRRGRPQNPTVLMFDKPFVFTISTDESGLILFAGIYHGEGSL